MDTPHFEGSCYCGDLRYEVSAKPGIRAQCHCRDCQYFCAGGPQTFFMAPASSFRVTSGTPRVFTSTANSGNTVNRHFCNRCCTPVFITVNERPDDVMVSIGSLSDPSAISPRVSIWTKSAACWAYPNPDLHTHS